MRHLVIIIGISIGLSILMTLGCLAGIFVLWVIYLFLGGTEYFFNPFSIMLNNIWLVLPVPIIVTLIVTLFVALVYWLVHRLKHTSSKATTKIS